MQFQAFDWLISHGTWAIIPCPRNIALLNYLLVVFAKQNQQDAAIFQLIPLALVGYEMIITNLALRASLAVYHLTSNACSWNNNYYTPARVL